MPTQNRAGGKYPGMQMWQNNLVSYEVLFVLPVFPLTLEQARVLTEQRVEAS
jgi:hypothetical protein